MDITEIHSIYGIEALNQNKNLLTWLLSRQNVTANESPMSALALDASIDSSDQILAPELQHELIAHPIVTSPQRLATSTSRSSQTTQTDELVIQTKSTKTQWSDDIPSGVPLTQDQHPRTQSELPKERKPEALTTKDHSTYSTILKTTKGKENISSQDRTKITFSTTKENTPEHTQDENTQAPLHSLTDREQFHVAEDIGRAIAVAYRLHERKMTHLKSGQLSDCVLKELDTKTRTGKFYKPSYSTELNHPISLAKELVATHTEIEILHWQECTNVHEYGYCIFDFLSFSPVTNERTHSPLYRSLIDFGRQIMSSNLISIDERKSIANLAKGFLESKDLPNGYQWFRTQSRQITQSVNPPRPQKGQLKPTEIQEHKCPAIDENLLDFLNRTLNDSTTAHLKSKWQSLSTRGDFNQMKIDYANAISEIIKHNTTWRRQGFTVKQDHLEWVQKICKIQFQPMDLPIIRWIFDTTIKELAKEFNRDEKSKTTAD